MKTFIKAIEIWRPTGNRNSLELGGAMYGNLTEFRNVSEQQLFGFDEGLPGKAWACGHAIILTHFEDSYFKRTSAAHQAGITCGIALPIFSGEFLLAVVVFLCGATHEQAGAIEIWSNRCEEPELLKVVDGYYGSLTEFEDLSRKLTLSRDEGIAGLVATSGKPVLVEDISQAQSFRRYRNADQAGITMGIGLPAGRNAQQSYILTFLSSKSTPLAKRLQIWLPDPQGKFLVCQQGYSKINNDLAEIFEDIKIFKGQGALGRVWLTGMPALTGNLDNSYYDLELENLDSMLAIPIISHGNLTAIVTFLF